MQPDDRGVMRDLVLEIRRLKGDVTQAADRDHRLLPFA
jgi:hypothetical protein